MMPTSECWAELGALRAEVDVLRKDNESAHMRIRLLEDERIKVKTIGAIAGFILTGLGVFFSDPMRRFIASLLSAKW